MKPSPLVVVVTILVLVLVMVVRVVPIVLKEEILGVAPPGANAKQVSATKETWIRQQTIDKSRILMVGWEWK